MGNRDNGGLGGSKFSFGSGALANTNMKAQRIMGLAQTANMRPEGMDLGALELVRPELPMPTDGANHSLPRGAGSARLPSPLRLHTESSRHAFAGAPAAFPLSLGDDQPVAAPTTLEPIEDLGETKRCNGGRPRGGPRP